MINSQESTTKAILANDVLMRLQAVLRVKL